MTEIGLNVEEYVKCFTDFGQIYAADILKSDHNRVNRTNCSSNLTAIGLIILKRRQNAVFWPRFIKLPLKGHNAVCFGDFLVCCGKFVEWLLNWLLFFLSYTFYHHITLPICIAASVTQFEPVEFQLSYNTY